MTDPAARIIGLYDDKAEDWIADRGRVLGGPGKTLDETEALERFAQALPVGATVLDVGCGSGWPWGAALLGRGFRVTGVDASPRLIAHARESLPEGEWRVGDMRTFDLKRHFDGILVWYSLFHLTPSDQLQALERILSHAAPVATVLTTGAGPAGVQLGLWRGETLYHASPGASAHVAALERAGLRLDRPSETPEEGVTMAAPLFRRGAVPKRKNANSETVIGGLDQRAQDR